MRKVVDFMKFCQFWGFTWFPMTSLAWHNCLSRYKWFLMFKQVFESKKHVYTVPQWTEQELKLEGTLIVPIWLIQNHHVAQSLQAPGKCKSCWSLWRWAGCTAIKTTSHTSPEPLNPVLKPIPKYFIWWVWYQTWEFKSVHLLCIQSHLFLFQIQAHVK